MLNQMEPGIGRGVVAGFFGFIFGAGIPYVSLMLFSPYASYAPEGIYYIVFGAIAGTLGFLWGAFAGATFDICPQCKEQVKPDALKCKHCGSKL